jgi:hypothetical protein
MCPAVVLIDRAEVYAPRCYLLLLVPVVTHTQRSDHGLADYLS